MRNCIVLKILMLLCLSAGTLNAQTLALFREAEKGNAKIYDSTAQIWLYYNKADTIITNRHIVKSVVDAAAPYGVTISVKLDKEGRERFAVATRQSIGKKILIIVGNRLLSAPVVQGEIPGGEVQITGGFTYEEAKKLATALRQKHQTSSVEPGDDVKKAISKLDHALVEKDYRMLDEVLGESLIMGHSNAYFQTKSDVISDLQKEKIVYDKIEQHSIQEQDKQGGFYRVSRIIRVDGKYRGQAFSMKLAVMEIWKENETEDWQLWSRQAVKITE
ncbi:MAG: hypothetical protein BGO31_17260 [Bacteroidetes bacterium 43-16]|nr:MAG: hypothetical protein BGO31_17260 [Bacteroidetes bacterium 43-16]